MRSVCGADVGVAVAVAADPWPMRRKLAHRRAGPVAARVSRVQLRDLAQEGGFVVADSAFSISSATVSLVSAQQARLPQLRDARADLRLVGGQLARRQRVARQGARLDLVALAEQLGDVALGIEDALALHLGRVGGEHRRDVAARPASAAMSRGAMPAQRSRAQRHLDAAFLRCRRRARAPRGGGRGGGPRRCWPGGEK